MVVYNTSYTGDLSPGLYMNDGTKWGKVNETSETTGSVLTKVKYRGRNLDTNNYDKPTLKIPSMNIEFRFASQNGTNRLETRLLSAPTSNVTYYANELWYGKSNSGGLESITFTPSNWNIWNRGFSNGTWNDRWGYQYQISTKDGVIPGSNDLRAGYFYGFNNWGSGSGATNEMYVLAFDQY
jgi:hypothetical protein